MPFVEKRYLHIILFISTFVPLTVKALVDLWQIKFNFNFALLMQDLLKLAGEHPGLSVTIPAAELEKFGSSLVENAIARYKNELQARELAESEEKLLTAREVAAKFGVCAKTITRWRKAGYIEPVPVGGLLKYRLSDCKRILEEGKKGQ